MLAPFGTSIKFTSKKKKKKKQRQKKKKKNKKKKKKKYWNGFSFLSLYLSDDILERKERKQLL